MINAARFTTKTFDTIGHCQNQNLKDSWGSNYFVGDVYFQVPAGYPFPDLLVFGDNPIHFIMQDRRPSDQMKKKIWRRSSTEYAKPQDEEKSSISFLW